jgi:hypothetical protein
MCSSIGRPIAAAAMEDSMTGRLVAAALGSALWATAALAQAVPAETEDSRYQFHRVQDGFARLDSRTGQVSLCSKRPVGWACQAVPDERTALEGEIGRLQGENSSLKKELLSRGIELPGGLKADPPAARSERDLKLPSDAELDRVMTFFEKAWRRMVEMMLNLQKEVFKKS